MVDRAFLKRYGGGEPLDETLINIAKKHGQFAEIKIVTEKERPADIESGRYLIFGGDKKRVERLASNYSSAVLLPTAFLKQYGTTDIFPKASVAKIDSTFCGMVRILQRILNNELMLHLLQKYEQPLPEMVCKRDFKILFRTYQSDAKGELKDFLEIIAGGKTLEEYEQEQGKHARWFEKPFLKKEIRYTSVSANCVPKEHIIDLPYSKSMINVLHGEKGVTIRAVDKELGKYPNMKWSLKENATIPADGVHGDEYCHRITYPTKYEPIVASIVHKIELGLDIEEEDCNICKTYIKGAREDVFETAIPRDLFQQFQLMAADDGLEYYFDEASTYIRQKPDAVGICVEGELSLFLLARIEGEILKKLANDSHIDNKNN